jgi:hypothetical protein
MVNKITSINKAHILLLVRQVILENIIAYTYISRMKIILQCNLHASILCTEPTSHLIFCVRSSLLIIFLYADLLFQLFCFNSPVSTLLVQLSCFNSPVSTLLFQLSCFNSPRCKKLRIFKKRLRRTEKINIIRWNLKSQCI